MTEFDKLVADWKKQFEKWNACESDHDRCSICNDQLYFCKCHEELAQKVLEHVYCNGKDGSEATIISRVFFESLLEDSNTLAKLEAYGVDNWSGYSDALRDSEGMFEEEDEEEE